MARRTRRWIQKAIKRPGAFTRKAKARGMTVAQFARYVLSHKNRFSTRTIRQAQLALTLRRLSRRRKRR